jgi:hypothetical protein
VRANSTHTDVDETKIPRRGHGEKLSRKQELAIVGCLDHARGVRVSLKIAINRKSIQTKLESRFSVLVLRF